MASKVFIKNKTIFYSVICLFILLVIFGIQRVYAYYYESFTSDLLANVVGDFNDDGDFSMIIYREDEQGDFVRVYATPEDYYVFNDELTSCTIPCNDGTGNCEYSFDSDTNNFSISSNQEVTCKFYFEKTHDDDLNVYVLLEDEFAGDTYSYNSKNYKLVNSLPAFGYVFTEHYECDNDATVIYNSETKKFSLITGSKNSCYVYFDKNTNVDMIVNTYVQEEFGSETYLNVDSIPSNKIYTLNDTKSSCTAVDENAEAGIITYKDGYINVSATTRQVCEVYLDLESN